MKFLFSIVTLIIAAPIFAQEASVMEKRAHEFQRVINLNDKQEWIKFIKENYTQALIDKPMTSQVQTNENGKTSTSKTEMNENDKLEAKARMFARLHEDFSGSKLISMKTKDNNLEMVLNNGDGLIGTFKFKFEKTKPYLIDGISIEAGN
jgi:hypothetical protein